jgi:hypothetical protein
MAYELERIIGLLGDIRDGDGSPRLAVLVDCPVCGRPLDLDADMSERMLHAGCPIDRGHFAWRGDFTDLPEWFGRYRQLNT